MIQKWIDEVSGIDVRHIEKHADEDFRQRLEEFAELIVRECAAVAEYYATHEHWTGVSDAVLYHFGVEPDNKVDHEEQI